MKQKTKNTLKKNVSNFFGSVGYLACLLQWFWAVMLYFSVVQSTTSFVAPSTKGEQFGQGADMTIALPDPLKWGILVVVTSVMIAVTVYALIKMPMSLVKNSNKAVRKTAESVAPVVIRAQHKKVTEKSRKKMTALLIAIVKLFLVGVPVVLAAASGLLHTQYVDYSIATTVAYGLAALSIGAFVLQYGLARMLRVAVKELW